MPRRRNLEQGVEMPKLKTKSGAKKRFGRTATGKVKRNRGNKQHRLIRKSSQENGFGGARTRLERGDGNLVLTDALDLRDQAKHRHEDGLNAHRRHKKVLEL